MELKYRGRVATQDDIASINRLIDDHPTACRRRRRIPARPPNQPRSHAVTALRHRAVIAAPPPRFALDY
jgi:hypothetical protein